MNFVGIVNSVDGFFSLLSMAKVRVKSSARARETLRKKREWAKRYMAKARAYVKAKLKPHIYNANNAWRREQRSCAAWLVRHQHGKGRPRKATKRNRERI